MLNFVWIILDHPRSAIVGLSLAFKFRLDRIHCFGDMAIFYISALWLVISAVHAQSQQQIYFRGGNHQDIIFVGINLPIQHPTSIGVAFRKRGVYTVLVKSHVKPSLSRNFVPSKIASKFPFKKREIGSKFRLFSGPHKTHSCAKRRHRLGCRAKKEPRN